MIPRQDLVGETTTGEPVWECECGVLSAGTDATIEHRLWHLCADDWEPEDAS